MYIINRTEPHGSAVFLFVIASVVINSAMSGKILRFVCSYLHLTSAFVGSS